MKLSKSLVFSIIFLAAGQAFGQNVFQRQITWKTNVHQDPNVQNDRKLLGFEEAVYQPQNGHLPVFYERIDAINGQKPSIEFEILSSRRVNYEQGSVPYLNSLDKIFDYEVQSAFERGSKVYFFKLVPARQLGGGVIEVIDEFKIKITWIPDQSEQNGSESFKKSKKVDSKLKSGNWYRIKVPQTGIYRLNKSFFESNEIPLSGVDARKISVYGYGGTELPMLNSAERPEDLAEIPALGKGLDDGKFDENDYLLFYAEGPIVWELNNKGEQLRHSKHTYSEDISYFINVGDYLRNVQLIEVQRVAQVHILPTNMTLSLLII